MKHDYASPLVVKYGGAVLSSGRNAAAASLSSRAEVRSTAVEGSPQDAVIEELAVLHAAGQAFVLVHGGGPEIDRRLAERGIISERVAGHRVTDAVTLETVEAVLCGELNKRLVRACLAHGIPAVGISGEDGKILIAERARREDDTDLGFVGEITECNPKLLQILLDGSWVPVVAPLAVARDAANAYNVNADLAAAAIAAALHASAFVAITDVARVLQNPDDPTSGIDCLTIEEARAFAATEACRSSMKPKVLAAAAAVAGGAQAAYICAAQPNAIAAALDGDATIISN